jgi:hypothetical protein
MEAGETEPRSEGTSTEEILDFGSVSASPTTRPVHETIALETHKLRIQVAWVTLGTFLVINGLVLAGLYEALIFDFHMITEKMPGYTRFIDTTVISSILGATTVQLGAMMFAIAKFLFPSK